MQPQSRPSPATKLEAHVTGAKPVGVGSPPVELAAGMPRVMDVKFASAILCGAVTETRAENKGQWGVDVDLVARVVIVTRMDERNRINTTIVPFENVSYVRYEMEITRP